MKYKVGQRVKVIANRLRHGYEIGGRYTIDRIYYKDSSTPLYSLGGSTVCTGLELRGDFNEYLKLV